MVVVVVVVEGENVIRHVKREWELSRRDLSSWECVRGNVEGGISGSILTSSNMT